MSAESPASAVLAYIDRGTFPEDESIAATDLTQQDLRVLLVDLRKAKEEIKNEIRTTSKSAAPDIDTWIARAKDLQLDIQKSRDTARAIVAQAEAGNHLRLKAVEARNKAELLGKEVRFNESLAHTLQNIQAAKDVLRGTQEALARGSLESALDGHAAAQLALNELAGVANATVCGILRERHANLKNDIEQLTTRYWNQLFHTSQSENTLIIRASAQPISSTDGSVEDVTMQVVARAAHDIGVLTKLLQKFARDLELTIFKPRLNIDAHGKVGKITVQGGSLQCSPKSEVADDREMFADVHATLEYLYSHLTTEISPQLATILLPTLISRLEDIWFDPGVPLEIDELPAFQDLLDGISSLASQIEGYEWQGHQRLKEWVTAAPKTWLTKQREAVLGEVRNNVFSESGRTRTVERIETQTVAASDIAARSEPHGAASGDDWDADWDEGETQPEKDGPSRPSNASDIAPKSNSKNDNDDDEEAASAWDFDPIEDDYGTKDSTRPETIKGEDDEDGAAWGWDEEAAATDERESTTLHPVKASAGDPSGAKDQTGGNKQATVQVTLRESFTITSVPDTIASILKRVVTKAQILADPKHAKSAIAPASSALYTLPTLVLAIFRATASTVYTRSAVGNMLAYNDATYLASELREWQTGQAANPRLRLDADVKALDAFAKKAYSTEMDAQRTILQDLLDGAQGFSNSTTAPFKQECESAVEQAVFRLRDVHRQWRDVLSEGILLQTIGSLVATGARKIITEIEDLADIGEADSHQLTALIQKFSEVKDLFIRVPPGAKEGNQEKLDMTFVYCPNWLKLQYLAEIMESSLADIRYLWNEGELSLEYDAEEVIELIQALFAESDVRRKTIAEIRRSGRGQK